MPEVTTETAHVEAARPETSRTRSPNYPSIPLNEAINRARQVYDKEHTYKASAQTVAEDMGYTSLNGTSRTTISALKKYGLLQADGDGVKISSDAVDIFELPADDPIAVEARRRAAFKPALFAEFKETYGDRLPSDGNLRHVLIKRGFNPRMASEVIQIYKDTLTAIGGEIGAGATPTKAVEAKQEETQEMPKSSPAQQPPSPEPASSSGPQPPTTTPLAPNASDSGWSESLEFRVGGSKVRLLFEGTVTQESIGKLIRLLEISKDEYPTSASLIAKETKLPAEDKQPKVAEITGQTSLSFPPVSATGYAFDSPRPAIWHSAEADIEVSIAGVAGEQNGVQYLYNENRTGIPASEVEFLDDLEDEA
jgi:hypothetical protein